MDIVFIHSNFPGQFKQIAASMAGSPENNVVFLTANKEACSSWIKGVTVHHFDLHRQPSPDIHSYLSATELAVIHGQAVIRSLDELIQAGLLPRLIITHAGNGLGFFIKDFIPAALLIGYFEWYFSPPTTQHLVSEFNINTRFSTNLRNLSILYELQNCDGAIVPTEWQKQQFPHEYQHKLNVIFDGVDQNFFSPPLDRNKFKQTEHVITNRDTKESFLLPPDIHVLTYATRGMEPVRGFPEFMSMLPPLFSRLPSLSVYIAGIDRVAYSFPAPSHNGSWKNYLLDLYDLHEYSDRLNFTGLLDYNDYKLLLFRSSLHVYFTRPYVPSWSLFESASCAVPLLSNRSPATSNIIDNRSVYWIDLDNIPEAVDIAEMALTSSCPLTSSLLPGYGLNECLISWQSYINKCLEGDAQRSH